MSASPIPDIDRLSMEQRIRRLEAGGGSGGGGGNLASPDFDQYPDNAFSETPEGLICKISIDDLASVNVPEYSGIGIKLNLFWCNLFGPTPYIPIAYARVRLTKTMNSIQANRVGITYNGNIANRDLYKDLYCHNWPTSGPGVNQNFMEMARPTISFHSFSSPNGLGSQPFESPTNIGELIIYLYYSGLIRFDVVKSSVSQVKTAYPCYMFGVTETPRLFNNPAFPADKIYAGSSYGAIDYGAKISVAQLTDLPSIASKIYPKSWCV